MPQTAIPTAAGETAGSGRAPHYLLAYLEEGRVRVYAPDKSDIWIGVQLPEAGRRPGSRIRLRQTGLWVGRQLPGADEMRIEAELQRLHRTGQRTGIVEMCLPTDGAQRGIRVLCVRA